MIGLVVVAAVSCDTPSFTDSSNSGDESLLTNLLLQQSVESITHMLNQELGAPGTQGEQPTPLQHRRMASSRLSLLPPLPVGQPKVKILPIPAHFPSSANDFTVLPLPINRLLRSHRGGVTMHQNTSGFYHAANSTIASSDLNNITINEPMDLTVNRPLDLRVNQENSEVSQSNVDHDSTPPSLIIDLDRSGEDDQINADSTEIIPASIIESTLDLTEQFPFITAQPALDLSVSSQVSNDSFDSVVLFPQSTGVGTSIEQENNNDNDDDVDDGDYSDDLLHKEQIKGSVTVIIQNDSPAAFRSRLTTISEEPEDEVTNASESVNFSSLLFCTDGQEESVQPWSSPNDENCSNKSVDSVDDLTNDNITIDRTETINKIVREHVVCTVREFMTNTSSSSIYSMSTKPRRFEQMAVRSDISKERNVMNNKKQSLDSNNTYSIISSNETYSNEKTNDNIETNTSYVGDDKLKIGTNITFINNLNKDDKREDIIIEGEIIMLENSGNDKDKTNVASESVEDSIVVDVETCESILNVSEDLAPLEVEPKAENLKRGTPAAVFAKSYQTWAREDNSNSQSSTLSEKDSTKKVSPTNTWSVKEALESGSSRKSIKLTLTRSTTPPDVNKCTETRRRSSAPVTTTSQIHDIQEKFHRHRSSSPSSTSSSSSNAIDFLQKNNRQIGSSFGNQSTILNESSQLYYHNNFQTLNTPTLNIMSPLPAQHQTPDISAISNADNAMTYNHHNITQNATSPSLYYYRHQRVSSYSSPTKNLNRQGNDHHSTPCTSRFPTELSPPNNSTPTLPSSSHDHHHLSKRLFQNMTRKLGKDDSPRKQLLKQRAFAVQEESDSILNIGFRIPEDPPKPSKKRKKSIINAFKRPFRCSNLEESTMSLGNTSVVPCPTEDPAENISQNQQPLSKRKQNKGSKGSFFPLLKPFSAFKFPGCTTSNKSTHNDTTCPTTLFATITDTSSTMPSWCRHIRDITKVATVSNSNQMTISEHVNQRQHRMSSSTPKPSSLTNPANNLSTSVCKGVSTQTDTVKNQDETVLYTSVNFSQSFHISSNHEDHKTDGTTNCDIYKIVQNMANSTRTVTATTTTTDEASKILRNETYDLGSKTKTDLTGPSVTLKNIDTDTSFNRQDDFIAPPVSSLPCCDDSFDHVEEIDDEIVFKRPLSPAPRARLNSSKSTPALCSTPWKSAPKERKRTQTAASPMERTRGDGSSSDSPDVAPFRKTKSQSEVTSITNDVTTDQVDYLMTMIKVARQTAELLASFITDKDLRTLLIAKEDVANTNLLLKLCEACQVTVRNFDSETSIRLQKTRSSRVPTEYDLQQMVRAIRRRKV